MERSARASRPLSVERSPPSSNERTVLIGERSSLQMLWPYAEGEGGGARVVRRMLDGMEEVRNEQLATTQRRASWTCVFARPGTAGCAHALLRVAFRPPTARRAPPRRVHGPRRCLPGRSQPSGLAAVHGALHEHRFAVRHSSGPTGSCTNVDQPNLTAAGETWSWQAWYRDVDGELHLSSAVAITGPLFRSPSTRGASFTSVRSRGARAVHGVALDRSGGFLSKGNA